MASEKEQISNIVLSDQDQNLLSGFQVDVLQCGQKSTQNQLNKKNSQHSHIVIIRDSQNQDVLNIQQDKGQAHELKIGEKNLNFEQKKGDKMFDTKVQFSQNKDNIIFLQQQKNQIDISKNYIDLEQQNQNKYQDSIQNLVKAVGQISHLSISFQDQKLDIENQTNNNLINQPQCLQNNSQIDNKYQSQPQISYDSSNIMDNFNIDQFSQANQTKKKNIQNSLLSTINEQSQANNLHYSFQKINIGQNKQYQKHIQVCKQVECMDIQNQNESLVVNNDTSIGYQQQKNNIIPQSQLQIIEVIDIQQPAKQIQINQHKTMNDKNVIIECNNNQVQLEQAGNKKQQWKQISSQIQIQQEKNIIYLQNSHENKQIVQQQHIVNNQIIIQKQDLNQNKQYQCQQNKLVNQYHEQQSNLIYQNDHLKHMVNVQQQNYNIKDVLQVQINNSITNVKQPNKQNQQLPQVILEYIQNNYSSQPQQQIQKPYIVIQEFQQNITKNTLQKQVQQRNQNNIECILQQVNQNYTINFQQPILINENVENQKDKNEDKKDKNQNNNILFNQNTSNSNALPIKTPSIVIKINRNNELQLEIFKQQQKQMIQKQINLPFKTNNQTISSYVNTSMKQINSNNLTHNQNQLKQKQLNHKTILNQHIQHHDKQLQKQVNNNQKQKQNQIIQKSIYYLVSSNLNQNDHKNMQSIIREIACQGMFPYPKNDLGRKLFQNGYFLLALIKNFERDFTQPASSLIIFKYLYQTFKINQHKQLFIQKQLQIQNKLKQDIFNQYSSGINKTIQQFKSSLQTIVRKQIQKQHQNIRKQQTKVSQYTQTTSAQKANKISSFAQLALRSPNQNKPVSQSRINNENKNEHSNFKISNSNEKTQKNKLRQQKQNININIDNLSQRQIINSQLANKKPEQTKQNKQVQQIIPTSNKQIQTYKKSSIVLNLNKQSTILNNEKSQIKPNSTNKNEQTLQSSSRFDYLYQKYRKIRQSKNLSKNKQTIQNATVQNKEDDITRLADEIVPQKKKKHVQFIEEPIRLGFNQENDKKAKKKKAKSKDKQEFDILQEFQIKKSKKNVIKR